MSRNSKYIVEEINKLLQTDLNIISFGDLGRDDLLQVLCDILHNFGASPSLKVKNNHDIAVVNIIEALQKVQYEPSETPEEFREGIALGNTSIIHSILYWLLSNSKNVIQRAYLAKYVMKIECPQEVLREQDVQSTYENYNYLIDEFWNVYSENKKAKKEAFEANELQEGMMKIQEDIKSLNQRLEQQKQKVETIPNKEVLAVVVKNYRNEVIQNRKLEEQLSNQQNSNLQSENELRSLRELLTRKQSRRPSQIQPLEQISGELRTNKILAEEQLPEELEKCKRELKMYEKITSEREPTDFDLENIRTEISNTSSDIQKLIEQKMNNSKSNSDELAPFRNQASAIANKKQEISNIVMELREKLVNLEPLIAEKQDILLTLVGGPLLQGENLKQYVAKLRNYSIVYKEYKIQLQALINELGILTRTYEILKQIDPSIEQQDDENVMNNDQESIPNDSAELKMKIKKITVEVDQIRAETAQVREELKSVRSELQPLVDEYTKAKKEFDDCTGEVKTTLNKINEEIEQVQENIRNSETKWKNLHFENDRKTDLLEKLQQEAIDTLEDQSFHTDSLKNRLQSIQSTNKKLEDELNNLQYQKMQGDEQLRMLSDLIHLLKIKEKMIPY